jgi:RNA polymerase sigma factor (sigma-70 family)
MEVGLEFDGMQDRLVAHVRDSIESYRKRERALKKLEELSRKDAWAVAMKLRLMASREAKLWRRSCQEHFGFDVERWLAKGPMDFSPLTDAHSSGEPSAIVMHILSYAHWKCVRMLMSATEKAAIELCIDKDKAMCDIYVGWLRSRYITTDWLQYYSMLPTALREQLLVEEAGWAGSQLNLGRNKRLHAALTGWGGSVPENLARELPGAVLAAYGALVFNKRHSGSFLAPIAKALANMGAESTSRPDKLRSLPPDESLHAPEDEQMAELERKEILDALEQAAGLSPQQAEVWQLLRRGKEIREIATELGITKNSVSVQKCKAVEKLKEARRVAGL